MIKNSYYIFFKKLSNKLKIEIISVLKKKEMPVNELCKKLNSEQSKISHALASLRRCKIVSCKIKGKKRIYSLNKKTILPILKILDEHEENFCKGVCLKRR